VNSHAKSPLPLLCGLIVCAAVLMLGVDIWFRTETGMLLLWFKKNTGFWDALKYLAFLPHYRPVAFLKISSIYQLFGPVSLPFVLSNFVGFLVTLTCFYILVRHEVSKSVAYLSLMAIFPLFYHALYYPYIALNADPYCWDVAWCCLAIYLFVRSVEVSDHRTKYLIWATVISLVALGTHVFSALTVALVIIVYLLFNLRLARTPNIVIGIAIAVVCLALLPVLEPLGWRYVQSDYSIFYRFADRYSLLARILILSYLAPFLIGGLVQTIAHYFAKGRISSPLWAIITMAAVLILWNIMSAHALQMILLGLMCIILLFLIFRMPNLRIFALISLAGILNFFLVRGESSQYLRFLVFGTTPIIVFGFIKAGEGLLNWLKLPIPSHPHLPRVSVVLTALVLIGIALGMLNVPGFAGPVKKIRYFSNVTRVFRDVVLEGNDLIPPGSKIYYYRGNPRVDNSRIKRQHTQAPDIKSLYKKAHLDNLRPAFPHQYVDYFVLVDRGDLQFEHVEAGIVPDSTGMAYILASCAKEVKRTRNQFPQAEEIYQSQRGRAEAAIFRLFIPDASSIPLP
jgi:hypothetical protein